MATPYRQAARQFSTTARLCKKPNIQKPKVPWTERRILEAVTVPVFPPDTRPLPVQCYEEMQQKEKAKKSELLEAYHAFRIKHTASMFNDNKMVAICHILPMTPRDFFTLKTKIVAGGMKIMFANNDWAKEAVKDTKLQNLEPFFTSINAYIVSEEAMLPKLVAVLRKAPELQLLGGLVENRILSRDMMMNLAKLPPLDTMRGELCTILSASASKTSRLLGKHQQELSTNLDQLMKQGNEGSPSDSSVASLNDGSNDGDTQV